MHRPGIRRNQLATLDGGGGAPSALLTNLIVYWKVDESSGDRLDSHTGGYTLTDVNTVPSASGLLGLRSDHDYSNQEYFTAAVPVLSGPNWTYSIWVWDLPNACGTSTRGAGLGGRWYSSANYAWREWAFGYREDGTDRFSLSVATDAVGGLTSFEPAYSGGAGVWTHAVAQSNGTANTISVWIDGTEYSTASTGWNASTGSNLFHVGRHANGIATTWDINTGVDEIGYWDRVLTSDEIATIGANPPPAYPFS